MLHVSLIALPDVLTGSLFGALDLFGSVNMSWNDMVEKSGAMTSYFQSEIVSISTEPITCFAGTTVIPHKSIFDIQQTDIVHLPSIATLFKEPLDIKTQEVFAWICQMYQRGATICASCSGSLLMAETGLLDGLEATTHWAYVELFQQRYPKVILCPNRGLVQSGQGQKLVTTGSFCTWNDLVLYLIARYVGSEAAIHAAKLLLIKWNVDEKILAYASFHSNIQHHDVAILEAQNWLNYNFHQPNTVLAAGQIAGLAIRTFNRRFKEATGFTPITYIQSLRIEKAKVQLESSDLSVDAVGVMVGYEDSSYFRLLFKRITGMTPSEYRRKFKVPNLSTGQKVAKVGRKGFYKR